MGILKDSPRKDRKMGLTVVTIQVLAVVSLVTIDVVDTTAERADISSVILNLDDEINGRLLRGEPLVEIKNSHSSSFVLNL